MTDERDRADEPSEVDPEATQPSEIVVPVWGAETDPLGDAATELMRQPEEGGALDELFAADSFQEYREPLIPTAPRAARPGAVARVAPAGVGAAPARPALGRAQSALLWVAGSLAAVLVLVLVFVLGTRIPTLLGPAPAAAPAPTVTVTPTPTPTIAERPTGPVAPGDYRWSALGGGECLEPYVDAWQETYTVIDCAQPHGGQLVLRAVVPLPEGATEAGPYPGDEVLAAQMPLLCSAPGVLDLVAAGAFTDVQVQGSFPATAEQWDAGERDYFCFVSRAAGELITGSLTPLAG